MRFDLVFSQPRSRPQAYSVSGVSFFWVDLLGNVAASVRVDLSQRKPSSASEIEDSGSFVACMCVIVQIPNYLIVKHLMGEADPVKHLLAAFPFTGRIGIIRIVTGVKPKNR
jgi:hypothetical protein